MFLSIYSKLNRFKKFITNPAFRKTQNELRHDYNTLYSSVKNWAGNKPKTTDRYYGVVSFSNLPFFVKFHAISAKAMELKGYKSLIITQKGNRYATKVFKLFKIDTVVYWNDFVSECNINPSDVLAICDKLIPKDLSIENIIDIKFNGADVGKHALSMTCRKRIEGRLNINDSETYQLFVSFLKKAIESTLVADKLFKKYNIQKLLVRDSGYIPNGAIFEVGLEKGVDSVVVEFGQKKSSWIFKRHKPNTKNRHYFSISNSTWERLKTEPWSEKMDVALKKELDGRYNPNSDEDTRRLQSGKKIKSREEVQKQLGLNPQKKTAVIFSHVAWDATFFYGRCLFSDYEDWLYQTVNYVSANCPDVNWIVKVHPYNAFKLQRESIKTTSEERLLGPLMPFPDHIVFMYPDTDINTQSLFNATDYVLTVNGTVGFEFPCFGIPSLLAGTGRYEGFGFTNDPKSVPEYFESLKNITKLPTLTSEQILLAKKHYYYVIIGKQVMFDDIAPMQLLKLHEADSSVHNNIQINAKSLEDFGHKHSIKVWSDWMANSNEPDLIDIAT